MTRTTALTGIAILLTDDNPDMVELLDYLLAEEGASVRTARTAREALMILRTWTPNVMVLDISMPEIDGYELLTVIRHDPALHDVPALAVTGYTNEREKQRSRAVGFAEHISKPFEVETLINVITRLARRPSRAA